MDVREAEKDDRTLRKMEISFTPTDFPWLSENQSVVLFMVQGIDSKTTGWIGSCIERGSAIGKVAAELDPDESARISLSFISFARAFISGEKRSHTMHFIDPISGGPAIICITNGKLRAFFAETTASDGKIILVKVAVCRKSKEHFVLARVSSDRGANIR